MESKSMKQHVTLVATLHIGLGAFELVLACLAVVILFGVGRIADDADAARILGFIGLVAFALLTLFALPGIIGGFGLLRNQEWARILVLILSVLNLFNIPIGTVIGAYSIWVLLQEETAQLFAQRA
jgi:hypothetical protein